MKLIVCSHPRKTDRLITVFAAVLAVATTRVTAAPLLDQLQSFVDGVHAAATEAAGALASGVAASVADLTGSTNSTTAPTSATVSGFAGTVVALDAEVAPLSSLPDYVVRYAPYFYVNSQENWWPTDVSAFLNYVVPELNFRAIAQNVTFSNIASFNESAYLTSAQTATDSLPYLRSVSGKPNATAYSAAPITVVAVPKANGTLDAFYHTFWAFNKGEEVLGITFGDHVGDWEYCMIRFQNGVPQWVYLSAHGAGIAYPYDAMLQTQGRPTVYFSRNGHGAYSHPGIFTHADILLDYVDAGFAWDPMQNYRAYSWNTSTSLFTALSARGSAETSLASEGTGWLQYMGYWGDQQLPKGDRRQLCVLKYCQWTDGPSGPVMKNMHRTVLCEYGTDCATSQSVWDTDREKAKMRRRDELLISLQRRGTSSGDKKPASNSQNKHVAPKIASPHQPR